MKNFILLLLCVTTWVSCAPSTPQTRIQEQPEKFSSLTRKHQALVQQGQITSGMPPAAVELAWGKPDRRLQGSQNQQISERWDYTESRPVYTNSFYSSYGFGYGYGACGPYRRYGRRGFSTLGFALGPEVNYIPQHTASVWFIGNKVNSWERVQ